jgi:CheY-like chemotaxis protein
LRQVLLNVLGNAVKFTSQGEVVVRVALEKSRPTSVLLRFSVRDTGIGIPADKQDQIFQAFTQEDTSTTRRYGGTGLGLAIATRLVDLMGGRIWVESEVGRGSTFSFTSTFAPVSSGARAAPGLATMGLDGLRVLVVDDNVTNRRILEKMLASWRMAPTAVGDAAAALDALRVAVARGQAFQVVLSDGQMPSVDGYALAEQIASDPALRGTPVIMLTSLGRVPDPERDRKLEIRASIAKPVKHSDLLDALTSVFDTAQGGDLTPATLTVLPVPSRSLRVLVAEDHPVNRKLVTTILRQRGHTVKGVENGRQAVDVVAGRRPGAFDVIVMDLQMPEMSGIEATRAIRAAEGDTIRVPIIALTAHAMPGDRERCLGAGMDNYLAKPLDANAFIAAVEGFEASPAVPAAIAEAAADLSDAETTEVTFDEVLALRHAGGDRALLKEVIALFRADARPRCRKMERAIAKRDGEGLRLAAHALKGSIATIGSPAGRRLAFDLEQMGRHEQFNGATEALEALRELLARLDGALVDAGLLRRPSRRKGETAS